MKKLDFSKPRYFNNRELSWLAFNDRVLEEARDKNNPLLERVRFLGITQSNLDEFFNIRVASLKKMVTVNYDQPDAAGLKPQEQLDAISETAHAMVEKQYTTLVRSLLTKNECCRYSTATCIRIDGETARFCLRLFPL